MTLFDSHCHIDDPKFDEDRQDVLRRMREAGVTRCVCVGSDLMTSMRAIRFAEEHEGVYAAVGVHPHEAKDAPQDYLAILSGMLSHPKVVALGEIGLDYFYQFSPKDTQMLVFREQVSLAYRLNMPAIFHIRDAHGDISNELRSRKKELPKGIIHCFSGSAESAAEYVKMGFHISFAGPLTFKKAPNLSAAAREVPLDRLLIETDSPYLAPEPVRGRRNEPANVWFVCRKMAELRGMTPEEMAAATEKNALTVYRIPV